MNLELVGLEAGYSRKTRVLRDLHLSFSLNSRILLLGPNGAGKSTLMRILAGAMRHSAGSIRMHGKDLSLKDLRQLSVWMPQQVEPIPGVTVREQVAFAAWAGGVSDREAWKAADRAMDSTRLLDLRDSKSTKLSGGQLRRLGLAETFACQSEFLMLDEPTAGLDPAQRSLFREILVQQDRGFMVSTHLLDDIDGLYNHVVMLVSGRVVFSDSLDGFMNFCAQNGLRSTEEAFHFFVPRGAH